jgi:hypothetical protein
MAKLVTEVHQELMHYTTCSGLAGIISSGALWATHASALNDSQEITHFLDTRLIEIIREEATGVLSDLIQDPKIAKNVEGEGGFDEIVEKQTKVVVALLRESMLSFHQPHIFSLSAITSDRVRQSGLLSQWRGYGTDGGYAIIFDSSKLEELLTEEVEQHYYQSMQWGDVFYYGLSDVDQNIANAESVLRAGIRELQRSSKPSSMEQSYDAMITLSCLYKHWGFHEEQEVRVIAIPPNEEVLRLSKQHGEAREPRRISAMSRGGMLVPYLDLFGTSNGSARKLPIKQVIIGPHPLSLTRRKTVELLLRSHGYEATVSISSIPYLGR